MLLAIMGIISCSAPSLSPGETVRLYLEELKIFTDPFYKQASVDTLKEDTEEARRYLKAVKTIDKLIWKDKGSLTPQRRRVIILTVGTVITYEDYEIIDEVLKGDLAYVTVIFKERTLFNLDLVE